jgi:hypothetical protein
MECFMTVLVPRLVTTAVYSATLSLFLLVCSITAIESRKLRWDGSFCTTSGCAMTAVAAVKARPASGLSARTL